VPSQFGIAKPWNFCCRSRRVVAAGDKEALLKDGENEDARNFEQVADSLKN